MGKIKLLSATRLLTVMVPTTSVSGLIGVALLGIFSVLLTTALTNSNCHSPKLTVELLGPSVSSRPLRKSGTSTNGKPRSSFLSRCRECSVSRSYTPLLIDSYLCHRLKLMPMCFQPQQKV